MFFRSRRNEFNHSKIVPRDNENRYLYREEKKDEHRKRENEIREMKWNKWNDKKNVYCINVRDIVIILQSASRAKRME